MKDQDSSRFLKNLRFSSKTSSFLVTILQDWLDHNHDTILAWWWLVSASFYTSNMWNTLKDVRTQGYIWFQFEVLANKWLPWGSPSPTNPEIAESRSLDVKKANWSLKVAGLNPSRAKEFFFSKTSLNTTSDTCSCDTDFCIWGIFTHWLEKSYFYMVS